MSIATVRECLDCRAQQRELLVGWITLGIGQRIHGEAVNDGEYLICEITDAVTIWGDIWKEARNHRAQLITNLLVTARQFLG